MKNSEIEQLEINIEAAKEMVAKKEALTRLGKNKDFKMLIEEGYFKEEAARLVMAKSMPNFEDDASQKRIVRDIDAIGSLYSFLHGIHTEGAMAERSIEADQNTREEMLAEAL